MTANLPREIVPRLAGALEALPVVVLSGLRQSGKSTLLSFLIWACWLALFLAVPGAASAEADINDLAWERTRRLAAIFGVPTEGLPVITTQTWSQTATLTLQPFTVARQLELDSLLDRYTGAMSHGFFAEADKAAAEIQAGYSDRYTFDDFGRPGRSEWRCRATEPVYVFWPTFYRKLYREIARRLGARYRHFVWPPRINEFKDSKGREQFFLQVDAIGPAQRWADAFSPVDAPDEDPKLVYRTSATTLFLLFDDSFRLIARSAAIPGPREYAPLCQDTPSRLWSRCDLDGDGTEEWLVTTYGEPYSVAGLAGEFLILGGKGLSFRQREGLAPDLGFLEDVTGDGLPDAIVRFPMSGAHTSGAEFIVVTAHGGGLRGLPGVTGERRIHISDDHDVHLSGSRPPELILSGGSIGSAGAGEHRTRTETWGWDGKSFVLKKTVWEKTDLRHHTVYDGNTAFDRGDGAGAVAAYERAVNDAALKDDSSWAESLPSCRQFSAFRLALLYLRDGLEEEARAWKDWLARTYPDAPLTRAADALYREWRATKDLVAACAAVTRLLEKEDKPVGALADMGYGNPSIKAADVCPIH